MLAFLHRHYFDVNVVEPAEAALLDEDGRVVFPYDAIQRGFPSGAQRDGPAELIKTKLRLACRVRLPEPKQAISQVVRRELGQRGRHQAHGRTYWHLGRDDNPEMVSASAKNIRVKLREVTPIEREQAPLLSRGIGQLLVVGAPLSMGLRSRDDIVSAPSKTDGDGVKDVLVQVDARATHLMSRSRAPGGGSA